MTITYSPEILERMQSAPVGERFDAVCAMHTVVRLLNNEEAYYGHWIYIVPDDASDDDLMDIAEDDELFADTWNCFKNIMKCYAKDGIFADDKLF
jgi:hypothetical protein